MAEFHCYLLDRNRKVMAVDIVHALALPRAVTKGILAAAARHGRAARYLCRVRGVHGVAYGTDKETRPQRRLGHETRDG